MFLPKTNYVSKNGYSLIEILVVLFIILVMIIVGQVNYRDFSRREALEAAARQVKSDMKLAREYALSGRKSASCDELKGYEFRRGASPFFYQINEVCSSVTLVKQVEMPPNTRIEGGFAPGNTILFEVLGTGTDKSSDVNITITQISSLETTVITVTPSGVIK